MLIITDPPTLARALDSPLTDNVKRLLRLRSDLIDIATFVVVEVADTLADIERAAGIPVAINIVDGSRYGDPEFVPSFEWALNHDGIYELPYILSDDGSCVVIIVPDSAGIDVTLLAIAREHAEMAQPATSEGA